ncbi:YT521-B-like domain-containing protein [Lineolata rhizophorae]|uniref:YT521-B-like domain-containing protein n=1 Tax=Lineolata rhizophorae TaxID=578093 RepID=A0A6A6P9P3_9PEZI|nr:YT521-B-like domain-containing protein [Lineolata rhizophorae]
MYPSGFNPQPAEYIPFDSMEWQQDGNNGDVYNYGFASYIPPQHLQPESSLSCRDGGPIVHEPDLEALENVYGDSREDFQPNSSTFSSGNVRSHVQAQTETTRTTPLPGIGSALPLPLKPPSHKQDHRAPADELRARLIARRKEREDSCDKSATSKPSTPKPPTLGTIQTVGDKKKKNAGAAATVQLTRNESASDVDNLLAEGKAAAEAKAKQSNTATKNQGGLGSTAQTQDLVAEGIQDQPPAQGPESRNGDGNKSSGHKASDSVEEGEISDDKTDCEQPRQPGEKDPPRKEILPRETNNNTQERKGQGKPNFESSTMRSSEDNRPRMPPRQASASSTKPEPTQGKGSNSAARFSPVEYQRHSFYQPPRVDSLSKDRNNTTYAHPDSYQVHGMREMPSQVTDVGGRSAETFNTNDSRLYQVAHSAASAPVPTTTHSEERPSRNAAVASNYFKDLDEWLDITGYHDRAYRENTLKRHREMAELDRKKAKIQREAEIEREAFLARSQSVRTSSAAPDSQLRPSSSLQMPPPPIPPSLPLNSNENSEDKSQKAADITTPSTGSKRPYSPAQSHHTENGRPKHARNESAPQSGRVTEIEDKSHQPVTHHTFSSGHQKRSPRYRNQGSGSDDVDSNRRPYSRPQSSRGRSPAPLDRRAVDNKHDGRRIMEDEPNRFRSMTAHFSHGRVIGEISPTRSVRGRPFSPVPHEWVREDRYEHRFPRDGYDDHLRPPNPESGRSRYRSRGGHLNSSTGRGGRSGTLNSRGDIDDSRDVLRPVISPSVNGTRYFMIKSWNFDNVEASQREGIWATQPHNGDIFGDAFRNCRDVILVFSVNKSMAFQGYARMESPPGEAPNPGWVKDLLWPCSPPFYIRWITICETRFHKVGHLKNSLNDGQAVLVGRDGQEIDPPCGRSLCELIDAENTSRQY